jgi:hypothetical protein
MMLIGQTQQEVTLEVNRWKARWELYLTMPPSTATTERSFSVLKNVKTQ